MQTRKTSTAMLNRNKSLKNNARRLNAAAQSGAGSVAA